MKAILVLGALALAGCRCDGQDEACRSEQQAAQPTGYVAGVAAKPSVAPKADPPQRVTVERISVVQDSLAYNQARGVYVIRDNQTGREFIGVSGVGIAETGSHTSGKTTKTDER